MARTIHKFPLNLVDSQILDIPGTASILSVQDQGGVLTLWAMLDPQHATYRREVTIVGTGQRVPASVGINSYVDTVQAGSFVWHVFVRSLEHG